MQLRAEARVRLLQHLHATYPGRIVWAMTEATPWPMAAWRHQLNSPLSAGGVQRVRIVVGIAEQIALNPTTLHQFLRDARLVGVHRGHLPRMHVRRGIGQQMQLVPEDGELLGRGQ